MNVSEIKTLKTHKDYIFTHQKIFDNVHNTLCRFIFNYGHKNVPVFLMFAILKNKFLQQIANAVWIFYG